MRWKRNLASGFAALGVALVVAACGSGNDSNSGSATTGAPGDGSTVSARDVAGIGMALIAADGKTLYFADQETNGAIQCKDACLSFWKPLTVAGGTMPTAGAGVTGTLATVKRPDGSVQVTYNGKPLYTFTEDGKPGEAKGNGFTDTFNGTDFRWHAAATSGAAPTGAAPTGGYGNGY
jgi:predicted lipoprotein with Yx(FWY)xxD motif